MDPRQNQQFKELVLAECRKMIDIRLGSSKSLCEDVDIRSSVVELRKEFERSQSVIRNLVEEFTAFKKEYVKEDFSEKILTLESKRKQAASDVSFIAKRQDNLLQLEPRVNAVESSISSFGKQISTLQGLLNDLGDKHKASSSSISKLMGLTPSTPPIEALKEESELKIEVKPDPAVKNLPQEEFEIYKNRVAGELDILSKKIDTIISIAATQAALDDQKTVISNIQEKIVSLQDEIATLKKPESSTPAETTPSTLNSEPVPAEVTMTDLRPNSSSSISPVPSPAIKSNLPPGLIFGPSK